MIKWFFFLLLSNLGNNGIDTFRHIKNSSKHAFLKEYNPKHKDISENTNNDIKAKAD